MSFSSMGDREGSSVQQKGDRGGSWTSKGKSPQDPQQASFSNAENFGPGLSHQENKKACRSRPRADGSSHDEEKRQEKTMTGGH